MKEKMFLGDLSLKASLSLLGFFLVLAIVFQPPVAAAQMTMVSCDQLQSECFSKCNSEFDKKTYGERNLGCVLGCAWYRDLCLKHLGEIIKASAQEEMFLAEATLRVFEEAMER
jgi:hypothetical protein